MKNLKIGKRIGLAFAAILMLLLIVSTISMVSLKKSNGKFVEFFNNGHRIEVRVLEMRSDIQSAAKNVGYATMSPDLKTTGAYIDTAESDLADLQKGIQELKENYKGEQSLVSNIENMLNEIQYSKEKVFSLVRENKSSEAAELYFKSVDPNFTKIQEELIKVSDSVDEKANAEFANTQNLVKVSEMVVSVLEVLAVLATLAVSIFTAKSILAPVKEIERAAEEMSKGSLHVLLNYHSKDELGSLADSMRTTISNIGRMIDDISHLLGALAEGDFQVSSKYREQYVLDYKPILLAMRSIRNNLSKALFQINQSADLVANGSEQVSSGAQALSQGATEQASSIQELAAAISDISNQININAQNAKEARLKSEEAGRNVGKSNEKMLEMNQAMMAISGKSNEIGKIIKTIEDIAFQTNILALNAAVEAARAGEAGKGFAVVADEVRNLASKSGEAAKNTTLLIEETMKAVENGTRITSETTQAMQSVVESSQRINTIIGEIAVASDKQAVAVDQVAQGIDQISSVVQTTSATAEESAAASEELSSQAQMMKGLVEGFKLYDGEKEETPSMLVTESKSKDVRPQSPVVPIDPVYFGEPSSYGGSKY